jgi:hypothetical protein
VGSKHYLRASCLLASKCLTPSHRLEKAISRQRSVVRNSSSLIGLSSTLEAGPSHRNPRKKVISDDLDENGAFSVPLDDALASWGNARGGQEYVLYSAVDDSRAWQVSPDTPRI